MSGTQDRIEAALRAWCRLRPARLEAEHALETGEWRRLLHVARRQGVAGLIHRRVAQDKDSAGAPDDVRQGLRETALAQAAASARAEADLTEVIDAFHAAGIEPVLMRGLSLVAEIYEDGSLRAQIDHDLLVAPAEREAAQAALTALGFESASGAGGPYRRGAAMVDLHTDPYGRERVASRSSVIRASTARLRERSVRSGVAGRAVLVPCAEDRILLLAAHAAKHSFDKLIRLVDLAECWNAGGFRPEDLERRARLEGTADALFYALAAARRRVGAEIPESFIGGLRPAPRPAVDRAFARILDGLPSPFFAEWLLLAQLRGLRPRVRAAAQMLWPREMRERARSRGRIFLATWVPLRAITILGRLAADGATRLISRPAFPG